MKNDKCTSCNIQLASFDGVHVSNQSTYELLCCKCYNERISEYLGLSFDHVSFDPITMNDADGKPHTFVFRTRLLGEQVILSAFEDLKNGTDGYQFEVVGDAEDDLLNVFKLLFERMRRGLSRKHVEYDQSNQLQITANNTVRCQITSNLDTPERMPMLVIDGIEVTWEDFGRMMSVYEGFNFTLVISDRTVEQ